MVFSSFPVWAEGEIMEVTVRGHSAIRNEDLIEAERNALQDAMRNALEQAVGTFVSSESFGENFVLISDRISTKTQGYVKKYDILYKGQEVNIYTILIKAQVSLKLVKNDLIALKIIQEAMHKPRIMIIISERFNPNPISETEMIRIFVLRGFKVVDQKQVERIRENDQVRVALRGDYESAAAIGRQYGAEVFIIGNASTQNTGEIQGIQMCQVTIKAKAIECDTAEILAANTKSAGGGDANINIANKKAFQKASKGLADALIKQIITKWNERITDSRDIRLVISGIAFRQLISLEKAIKQLSGVKDMHRRSFEKGIATIDVQSRSDAQRLAEDIALKKFETFTVEVIGYTANRIDLRIVQPR